MDQILKEKIGSIQIAESSAASPSGDAAASGAASDGSEEHALVVLAQKGDRDAFRELVERYQTRAYRLAYTVIRDRAEAEDIVQEAFVKAYFSIANFENKSSFFSWLYRIVVNMALDFRRKRMRRGKEQSFDTSAQTPDKNEERALSDVLPDESPSLEASLISRESFARMKASLDTLSEEHRIVVLLREVEGRSYDEIAESLGVAKGTVMSRLFYARKKLQDDVNKE